MMLLLLRSLLDVGSPTPQEPESRLGGFVLTKGVQEVKIKSIFEKIRERAQQQQKRLVKLKASKSQKRKAREIETQAAKVIIENPINAESRFIDLMKQWAAFNPAPIGIQDATLEQLFAAEVAFRLRAIQRHIEAEQDEEEAILALLLS